MDGVVGLEMEIPDFGSEGEKRQKRAVGKNRCGSPAVPGLLDSDWLSGQVKITLGYFGTTAGRENSETAGLP